MDRRIDWAIAVCASLFVAVLAVSAYFDPTIRVLHGFEALPYVAAAVLCLRGNRFGYPLGLVSGAFWLWTAGFLTTFILNGFQRLAMLFRTGRVDRADILIAVPAAIATAGLALFSIAGYARQPAKSFRDVLLFVTALVIVPAFFIGIMAAFAPRYLGMFRFK